MLEKHLELLGKKGKDKGCMVKSLIFLWIVATIILVISSIVVLVNI